MSQRMLQLIQPPLGKQVLLDVLKLLEVCAHSCNPMPSNHSWQAMATAHHMFPQQVNQLGVLHHHTTGIPHEFGSSSADSRIEFNASAEDEPISWGSLLSRVSIHWEN
jgi:hypothetical protein